MLVLAQSLPRLTVILLPLSSCPHWRRDSVLTLQALQHRPPLLWVFGHNVALPWGLQASPHSNSCQCPILHNHPF